MKEVGLIPGLGKTPGGKHGNPPQYSCLENPLDRAAWWATVQGVTKSPDSTLQAYTHSRDCWSNPSVAWKSISRHRALQKGVSFLRTKSRDHVDTESAVGQTPDKPEKADSFCKLIANVYILETKKIPAGRLVLGWGTIVCLLEWASLLHCESENLLVMIRRLLAVVTKVLSQLQRWPWFWAPLPWFWCKASHL